MTTTAKEELAKVVASCIEALSEQSRFEKSLTKDIEGIERTIRHLEGRRGNEPVSAEVGQEILTHIRQAMNANQVNAQGTHILLLLLLKVSLLAQQESGMDIETLAEAQVEIESWLEQWTAANETWDEYTG